MVPTPNAYKIMKMLYLAKVFPSISTITHEKPRRKPSCIDNFITNDIESVIDIVSGTISNSISHYFQIFESVVNKSSNKVKHTQFYDHCNSNVDNFVSSLQDEINDKEIIDFSTFIDIFNDNLDKTCKLDVPKTTKRTIQNNPWITSELIVVVNQSDKLYEAWAKYRKKNVRMVRLIIGEVHVCALYAMTSVIITQCSKNIVKHFFNFLFNTYFTSVVPTALLLQCNWPITESEGSCKPARIKEVHSKLNLFQASLCTLTATHLKLIYVCTYIRLSVPLGCLIKQAGIIIHTILNMWETPGIEPVTSDLTSVYQISSSTN